MSYQSTINGVYRLSDLAFVPSDPANRDWLEYLDWVALGGETLPLDSPPENKVSGQGVFAFLKRIV
ncbi:hypothetical protein [Pseudomonas frederiksbergensis]|uniref:hypothetical protein n=1 Tax=Pseudomonas frederiksbergensis TaxID=104087 RepID=UPI000F488D3A|nr:hypothetical protein [Pseudomonas frederiksbergensis]RON56987.1 hypothetical protein BK667_06025 [Pseudomonas frederiksbergensis]